MPTDLVHGETSRIFVLESYNRISVGLKMSVAVFQSSSPLTLRSTAVFVFIWTLQVKITRAESGTLFVVGDRLHLGQKVRAPQTALDTPVSSSLLGLGIPAVCLDCDTDSYSRPWYTLNRVSVISITKTTLGVVSVVRARLPVIRSV